MFQASLSRLRHQQYWRLQNVMSVYCVLRTLNYQVKRMSVITPARYGVHGLPLKLGSLGQ